jgi:RNA polymerase sigma-70 factor (ECF subfamily)
VTGPTPEDVFARHHRDVYRYLVRMTGKPDVAEDLRQEVFLRVVRALRNGGPVGHERGWVFSIARNLLIDRRRDWLRHPEAVATGVEPAKDATQALAFGLDEALAALPDDDREVFLMKEVGGLRYDEIAAACGCTVESVRSRLWRTRAQLRMVLGPLRS